MARKEAGPLSLAAAVSAALSLGVFLVAGGFADRGHPQAQPGQLRSAQPLSLSPLAFEPAAGNGRAFVARGRGYSIATAAGGWTVALRTRQRSELRAELIGARTGTRGDGRARLPGTVNYMVGADKRSWRTGIPTYGRVHYPGVYAGTDVVYYGKGGSLEYDFKLRPGADPGRIAMRMSGARSLRVAANGDLVARLAGGSVRQHRPVAYQVGAGGKRRPVDAQFRLRGDRVSFDVGSYDRSRPLVIDPSLAFGDYIGGTGIDAANRVALDSAGNIYIAGVSTSASIPGFSVTRAKSTATDGFVMKLSPSGQRQWISYLGGSADDVANDIGLDASGRAYITGWTQSTNFPAGNAAGYENTRTTDGLRDAYIARFATDGTLSYATYVLGSDTDDYGLGIAVEGTGAAYIAVSEIEFPPAAPTTSSGYVMKYDSAGDNDGVGQPFNGTVDTMGGVGVIPGCAANCAVFATGRAVCPAATCGTDSARAAVVKYSSAGALLWGNYFSTTDVPSDIDHPEPPGGELPSALAVDSHGNPAITGTKYVTGPDHNYAFAARFDGATGERDPVLITWQTGLLNGDSKGWAVAFDGQDNLYVGTSSGSSNDDVKDAIQTFQGTVDGQVVKYFPGGYPGDDQSGHAIVWNTFLGGTSQDYVYGIAADTQGNVFAVGETTSSNFLSSPLSQSKSTGNDGFLVKIRTNSATIAEGPGDVASSHDLTFKYSSHETDGSFQCRLTGAGSPKPDFGPCGASSQAFNGVPDGAYTFEIKAFDSGGTTNGEVVSRAFTVDTAFRAGFAIAPNPALVGASVTFDATGSGNAAHPVTGYEWDLDGNGSFETNSGAKPTVTQIYPSAGTYTVGLKVTDAGGATATATGELKVNALGGAGAQFGVTINKGAQYTKDPDVVVTSNFPTFTTALLFSNDGGFGKAQTFTPKAETKWKLDSSGPERLPKTIYVRFLTGSVASTSFQDDIILDETPPKVDQAQVTPVSPAPAAGSAHAAKLRKYKVKMKARDSNSGVSKVQVTSNKRKPGKALKYKRKFTVKSAKRPKWVRARDRAGNWSKWKKAR